MTPTRKLGSGRHLPVNARAADVASAIGSRRRDGCDYQRLPQSILRYNAWLMFKKVLLVAGCLVGLAVVVGGAGIAYLFLRKPTQALPSSIKVAMTPERIARGKYLFESVADCGGCHSQRDFTRVGGPEVLSGR